MLRAALLPAVGLLALVAFVLEAAFLPELVWHDALVSAWFAARRGCGPSDGMTLVSHAAPYLGIGFVLTGFGLARVRRARFGDLAWGFVAFGAALLCVESLKVLFERARPDVQTWRLAGDAFPSGHVANIVLCVGTALRLAPRSSNARVDGPRLVLALAGLAAVTMVALSRLHLDRHWLTDVVGSVLLGGALLGLTSWRRVDGRIACATVMLVVIAGLLLSAAAGLRIDLSSPAIARARPQFHLALARANARDRAGLDGTWTRRAGERVGYLQMALPSARFTVSLRHGRRAVLGFAARLQHARATCCALEVTVDGTMVGRDSLGRRWGTYAFALPPLRPGVHDVGLRLAAADGRETPWALRRVHVLRAP
jgi:membrane-associated phospholipid phosphatase